MKRKVSVLFIIKKEKDDYFTGFKFLDKKIDIIQDNHEFDIPEEKFIGTNNYFTTVIELFNKENNASKKYLINIYNCKNIFHIYLTSLGCTFEFVFLGEFDFKSIWKSNCDFKFDNIGSKYIKRISVINYNFATITFGNWTIIPFIYCPQCDINKNTFNSFQLFVYSKTKIICQPNIICEQDDNIQIDNSTKDDEYSKDEYIINKLKENSPKNSFNSGNLLKEINLSKEEIKKIPNFLKKKRINTDEMNGEESKNINHKVSKIKDKIDSTNNLKEKKEEYNSESEMDILDKFDHEISYDNYIESDDDEACI